MESILSGICIENGWPVDFCRWEFLLSAVAMVLLVCNAVHIIFDCLKEERRQSGRPSVYDCLKGHQEKPNEETKEGLQNSGRPKRARKMITSL